MRKELRFKHFQIRPDGDSERQVLYLVFGTALVDEAGVVRSWTDEAIGTKYVFYRGMKAMDFFEKIIDMGKAVLAASAAHN